MRVVVVVVALASALVVGALGFGALPAGATPVNVRCVPDLDVDATCNSAYASIQQAVDAARPGDVVRVGPGVYEEGVVIDKTLTLLGIQVGTDARIRPGTPAFESAIAPPAGAPGGILIRADGVVVDGFTVRDALGCGVCVPGGVSGTQVLNTILKGNVSGLQLNNSGVQQAVVRNNVFKANNAQGPWSGDAIYSDLDLRGAAIQDNAFSGNSNASVVSPFTGDMVRTSDVTIQGNQMTGDGSILLYYSANVEISDNEIVNPVKTAVSLGGGNDSVTIVGNTFSGGAAVGLPAALGTYADTDPNTNVVVQFNSFEISAPAAVSVSKGRHVGPLHAENNWWGCKWGAAASTGSACGVAKGAEGALITAPWLPLPTTYGGLRVWSNGWGTTLAIHASSGEFGFVYSSSAGTKLCTGTGTARFNKQFVLAAACAEGGRVVSGMGALWANALVAVTDPSATNPYTLPFAWMR